MAQALACPRRAVAKLADRLPPQYLETLEQNQKIASCCRNPQEHDIEAWFSTAQQAARGVPDIYIFHCSCGRQHPRFCVGGGDVRPFWQVR